MRRSLLAVLLVIVLADLAQPVMLPWRSKFLGALAGAALYGVCAVGVVLHRRWPLVVITCLPLIPIGVLVLAGLGVAPVQPDAPMLGVLLLQVLAAGLSLRLLRP